MVKAKYILDYELIREQIECLLQSPINKLEREWSNTSTAPPAAYFVLVATLKVVRNTFNTIRFVCSEKSPDSRHRPEMGLSVPPLARTIVEALYTFIFLFEDLSTRSEWFMRAGWKELAEYVDRVKRDYGSNPDWREYLTDLAEPNLAKMSKLIGEPEEQLRGAKQWPIPSWMKDQLLNLDTVAFFQYLDDWFYREFSQISHLTLPGLIHSAGALVERPDRDEGLEQMRGFHFMQVLILLISLYSEVEAELKLGVSGDLKYVREIFRQHYPLAMEIHKRRDYVNRLR
jgi:hypothetical protein